LTLIGPGRDVLVDLATRRALTWFVNDCRMGWPCGVTGVAGLAAAAAGKLDGRGAEAAARDRSRGSAAGARRSAQIRSF
jgi:hypothetical protein